MDSEDEADDLAILRTRQYSSKAKILILYFIKGTDDKVYHFHHQINSRFLTTIYFHWNYTRVPSFIEIG